MINIVFWGEGKQLSHWDKSRLNVKNDREHCQRWASPSVQCCFFRYIFLLREWNHLWSRPQDGQL